MVTIKQINLCSVDLNVFDIIWQKNDFVRMSLNQNSDSPCYCKHCKLCLSDKSSFCADSSNVSHFNLNLKEHLHLKESFHEKNFFVVSVFPFCRFSQLKLKTFL